MPTGALSTGLQTHPAATGLVNIAAGTYVAGGVTTEAHSVTVARGFFTPPGEITNAQARFVMAKYGDRPDGLFLTERSTGYKYLFAIGRGHDVRNFATLPPELLPPHLAIRESIKELLANPKARANVDLGPLHDPEALARTVKRALPREDRYDGLTNKSAAADDHVAITRITAWQAQTLAQLLGDPEIADQLFGLGKLGGSYYADLFANDPWGLMALEGVLEYMTQTGKLTDERGQKLRAYRLAQIVRADAYRALSNGVLPNTTWNWVKDFTERGQFQILRGGSWLVDDREYLRTAAQFEHNPDGGGRNDVGLRVGFFSRT